MSSRSSHSQKSHRPLPQATQYINRSSTSSSSSSSSSSSTSSSASSSYYGDSYSGRSSMDSRSPQPRVEILRCSRCAKCVETVASTGNGDLRRVSNDDASASGMVRFGHNLYYCERCAKMVGYQ